MSLLTLTRALCFIVCFVAAVSQSFAQYTPGVNNNVTRLSQFHKYSRYSNLWGYVDESGREYVLVGHIEGTSIIDITEPENPVEIAMIPGPTRLFPPIWREIKTYSHYAYVVSELRTPDTLSGIQIIDLSGLPDSVNYVGRRLWPGVDSTNARAHTISIDDQGYMYIHGGTAALGEGFSDPGGIRIFSLADPMNPLPVSTFPDRYVHDSNVVNNIMFSHNIREPGGRIDVVDVSDRSMPRLITSIIYPNGGLSHDGWPTEDQNYYISTDEVAGLTMKVWDIGVLWDNDPNNDDQIELVGQYIGAPDQIGHEARVRGDFVFLSHYVLGMKVLDISEPSNPVEVGYFDTFPEVDFPGLETGYNGNWGVYPYFPSGTIAVTDIQTGVHILRFDTVRAGSVTGTVTDRLTGQPVPNVEMLFVEADKTVTADENGHYTFASNEGPHTVVLTRIGFFTDTTTVIIEAGGATAQDLTLPPNLVDIELSVDELGLELSTGARDSVEIVVRNAGGAGSVLKYTIDDVNGPVNAPETAANSAWQNGRLRLNFADIKIPEISLAGVQFSTQVADTVLKDPEGDLLAGTGGDVIGIYVIRTDTEITFQFEFAQEIDLDSTIIGLAMDTDFDVSTGAFPGLFGALEPTNSIGSEFDLLLDIPGIFTGSPLTAFLFVGNNDIDNQQPIASIPVFVSDRIVSLTVALAAIKDDGNMAIAGIAGHFDSEGEATSVDFLPDLGNVTVGLNPKADVTWIGLSASGGELQEGEADTIIVHISTAGLDGTDFSAVLLITTNDPDEIFVQIPVTLSLVTRVEDQTSLPAAFSLKPNYPNPFNPETTIRYELAESALVQLDIFNLLGQKVRSLVRETKGAGVHKVVWDSQDDYGRALSSGIYIYRITANNFVDSHKMILLQ